jgi:hypothetical protein
MEYMPRDPLIRIHKLKQTSETWQGTTSRARTWIFPKKQSPYRPYHFLMTSEFGQVLNAVLVEQYPTADQVWEKLLRAMRRPKLGAGPARRPKIVALDDELLVKHLAPRLADIGIECHYLKDALAIKSMLRDMEQVMNRDLPTQSSLLSVPRVTIPLLGSIFSAAADLYTLAPWDLLAGPLPVEICCPADSSPRYIVIPGSSWDDNGFNVVNNWAHVKLLLSGLRPGLLARNMDWFSLTYEIAPNLAFDDLDALEQFGWMVVNEHAYPLMGRMGQPYAMRPPTSQDLFWMEGSLPALVTYFRKHLVIDEGKEVQPFEHTYLVETLSGSVSVQLKVPVFSDDEVSGQEHRHNDSGQ